MKTFLIIVLTFTATAINAQNTVTWIGGTPGNETTWNEARNWSNHRVPDVFSDVIIPDVSSTTFAYPVIENEWVEINSIFIYPTSRLKIDGDAKLVTYAESGGLANIVQEDDEAFVQESTNLQRMSCSEK